VFEELGVEVRGLELETRGSRAIICGRVFERQGEGVRCLEVRVVVLEVLEVLVGVCLVERGVLVFVLRLLLAVAFLIMAPKIANKKAAIPKGRKIKAIDRSLSLWLSIFVELWCEVPFVPMVPLRVPLKAVVFQTNGFGRDVAEVRGAVRFFGSRSDLLAPLNRSL
jgi:hypothetical protein